MPAVESQYLEPQSAVVPFVQGLDQKSDPKAVQAPKLLDLKAASFFRPGEISKDRGYALLTPGTAPTVVPRRVIGCNGNQLLFAEMNCYKYTNAPDRLVMLAPARGAWATSSVETLGVNRELVDTYCDYAYTNGYELLVVYNFTNALVTYTIRERSSGTILHSGKAAKTIASTRGAAFGLSNGYLGIVWLDGANCKVLKWNSNTPATPPSTTNAATDATGNYVDACALTSARIAIVFAQNGTGKLKVVYRDVTTDTNVATNTGTAATIDRAINVTALADGSGTTFVSWCDSGTGLHGAGFNAACALIGTALMDGTAVATGVITAVEYLGNWAIAYMNNFIVRVITASSGAAASAILISLYGYTSIAHRAISLGGSTAPIAFGLGKQRVSDALPECYYTTVVFDPARTKELEPLAWYLRGVAYDGGFSNCQLVNGEYRWSAAERDATGGLVQSALAFRIDDGSAIASRASVSMAGGVTVPVTPGVTIDGCLSLSAFPFAPEITSIAESNTGAGNLVVGKTYQYVAVFEFIDDDGERHQSAPSLPVSKTITAAHDSCVLTVTTPYARRANTQSATLGVLRTVLYRTQGDGVTHKRTPAVSTADSLDTFAAGLNSFTENASDATIATAEELYTDGGALENSHTPHGRVLVLHQDRAWTIDEHTGELRYTKEIVEGEGFGWHPDLAVDLANNGISGKALVSTNNGLWIFGTDTITGAGAIQFLVGSGPSDNGLGSSYALQRLEGVTVSCQDQRHCVTTPLGVLFYDPQQGFHLLSAQAAPAFVGAEAQRLVSGSVLGMHVMSDRKEVRITLSTSTILIWHYDVMQWSQRPIAPPGGGEGISALIDACMWSGRHTLLYSDQAGPNPDILQQTTAGYTDATGTFYPLSLDTAWIKAASFKGLQRIWRITLLGRAVTPGQAATAQASLWYDYDDTSSPQVLSWSASEISQSTNAAGVVSVAIVPSQQLCESFKLRIDDVSPGAAPYYGGIAWTAMRIDYGIRRGRARQGDTAVRG